MNKILFSKKFYRNFFIRKYISLSMMVTHFFDSRKDMKICGCSLVKYVPSLYRETMGATGSQSTCYWSLDKVFKGETFIENDNFIDIGCGKGRVLAYMLRNKYPCKLNGIELNKDVTEYAMKWAEKYDNVTIINGNAFDIDLNDFSVFFLFRPFETETFYNFIDTLEKKVNHNIKMMYMSDRGSGAYLEDRKGWTMLRRDWVFNKFLLFMSHSPQRYSIWEYDP